MSKKEIKSITTEDGTQIYFNEDTREISHYVDLYGNIWEKGKFICHIDDDQDNFTKEPRTF